MTAPTATTFVVTSKRILHDRHHIDHTTLQVDHVCADDPDEHCVEPHGQSYRGD